MNTNHRNIKDFLLRHGMDHSTIDMDACSRDYLDEMAQGLETHGQGSLQMIPTFLDAEREIPKNRPVLAIDAGGTNFRTASIHFNDAGKPVIQGYAAFPMPGVEEELDSEQFFTQVAGYLEPAIEGSDTVGFCFSYPLEMLRNHDGRLTRFTKEIKAKDVEGRLIGEELNNAIEGVLGRKKKQMVLLNDTVSTLLAGRAAYQGSVFDSYIGFILGTGMNCCYIEGNGNILKEPDLPPGKSQIINVESGAYGRAPRGELDRIFDMSTDTPGNSLYEKMISGGYFGQMLLTVLKTGGEEGLFSSHTRDALQKIIELDTKDAGAFFQSPMGDNLLSRCIPGGAHSDRERLYFLIARLMERAAKFVAITLASIVLKSGKGCSPCLPVCITADGSTFYKFRSYQDTIKFYLKDFLVDRYNRYYQFVQVDNAPLVGAAIAGLMA